MIEGILVNADIHRMMDSFKSLNARTYTDWKVSVGKGKKVTPPPPQPPPLIPPSVNAYPLISEVKKIIDNLLESIDNKDFTSIHNYLRYLIDLNVTHGSIFFEKTFLDEAIVFLDEIVLEEITDSKYCQALIDQLSELIENSPPFYKGHLISCKKKLLEAKEEYQRKEKLEALNSHIKFGLEKDDYFYALYFIKEAQKYLEEQEANKYLKEKIKLIFTEDQCHKAVELTNKISDLEADHKYKEASRFLKQLQALNPYSTRVNARCKEYENYILLDEAIPVDKDIYEFPVEIKDNINILEELPPYLRSALNKKLKGVINNVRKKALVVAKEKRFDTAIEGLNHAYMIEFDSFRKNLVSAEMDKVLFQRKIYKFVKALISTAAAAAIIGVIYVLVSQISSCHKKKEIEDHINQAQMLFRENKYERLKETLNQLSVTVKKVEDIERIDDIKNLYEQLFTKLRMRIEDHEKKGEYDEAIKYAETAKEFAVIGKRFVIKGLPENLPTQWTRGYEGLIKRLNYKKFFQLGNLDYKNKRFDPAINNLETAGSYNLTKEVEDLLRDVKYEKNLETGRSYLDREDYQKALQYFNCARSYKSTEEIIALIAKAQKGPRIQLLIRNFEYFKNSKNTEMALKTLLEIKKVEEEPYNPFDLLLQVSYQNSKGYPEVTLGLRSIKFVFIQGGEFEMGCFNPKDQSLLKDAPLHRVGLSSFWISTTEITEIQYGGGYWSNTPVNNINWTSAYNFSRKFGEQFELNSNLPTEAQWEYTARNGGKKTIYPWGDDISCQKANYRKCYWSGLRPVASYYYSPNEFGIFDLAGNVREWCRDVYNKDYYSQTPITDPVNTRGVMERVVRGGSFGDNPMALKTYVRNSMAENSKDIYTGFRIVLEK